MKKTGEQKQNLFHRMQKKLLLVSRERDSYRLQLDSYEKDLTVTLNPNNININQLQTQRERIEALEKIVDNYRELNSKLESDLQSSNPALYSGTYLRCISINKFVLITYQEVNFIVSVKI